MNLLAYRLPVGHNEDWETNTRRCPMHLGAIGDVDDDWPDAEVSIYGAQMCCRCPFLREI